uniref:Uncharacterized protein n=1 Tax=Elaeophora elaphi TaxID=1147741 RepID=A0A0R3RVS2_9BILA
MSLNHFLTLFVTLTLPVLACGDDIIGMKKDAKRQVSLTDIIQGALNFVRPIIGTSERMQSDVMTSRKFRSEQLRGRDAEILGSPKHSALDDIPICKSNSKLCKFIVCNAQNFQNDESVANLNLAAQMLADTKLRKAIASDSSILLTACQEQGLSPSQCKLFANAFQLIDRFISTIEPLDEDAKKMHHYVIKDDPYHDDSDAPPVPIQPGVHQDIGSRTWSTKGRNSNESVTPIPVGSMLKQVSPPPTPPALLTFPPLIFTFPTSATVAPMISHPSSPAGFKLDLSSSVNLLTKEMQMLVSRFNDKSLLPNIMSLPLPLIMLPEQLKAVNPVGSVRNRRSNDYYDNIEEEDYEMRSASIPISDNNQQLIKLRKQTRDQKGLVDCMKILKDN